MDAEEGEEESEVVSDENIDVDDGQSLATAKMRIAPSLASAPSLAGGSLANIIPEKPKKARKVQRFEEQVAELEQDTGEDLEAEVDGGELPDWVERDETLKKIVTKLGKIHRCFHSMSPEQNFQLRKPVGHQLTGVGAVKTACFLNVCFQFPNNCCQSGLGNKDYDCIVCCTNDDLISAQQLLRCI